MAAMMVWHLLAGNRYRALQSLHHRIPVGSNIATINTNT